MKSKNLLPFLMAIICLTVTSLVMAEDSFPINDFKARYDVYSKIISIGKNGIPIGEAVLTLTHDSNGYYRMSSDVRPNGMASLLVSVQIQERVSGQLRNGAVLPAHYEQQRTGRKERTVKLNFNWRDGIVQAQKNDKKATLPLAPRVVDPLSLHLLVMTDLQKGKQFDQYTLVSETDLKTYRVTRHGTEILQTPLGALQTVRISKQKPGGDDVTTFWFAPALSYLPVQITQEKDGSEELRLLIRKVDGIALK